MAYPNKLYNLARMTTATTGTGTITLGSAVSGFLTFAQAGVQDGEVVSYGIRDGSNSEAGYGTYASSGTTLTRTVVSSTNSNSAITLSGSAEVYVTALAGDILYAASPLMRSYISGLTLSNDGGSPNTVIDVASGAWASDDNTALFTQNSGTINCATTGANGLDTGSLGASTWYYTFAIAKADRTTAFLASASLASPTMPSGYTLKRRIGCFKTDGSSHILSFTQRGNYFEWVRPVTDISNASQTTSGTTRVLPSVPNGLVVKAKLLCVALAAGATGFELYVTPLTTNNQAPGVSPGFTALDSSGGTTGGAGYAEIWTDTSQQIRTIGNNSNGGTNNIYINVLGWLDLL